MLALWDYFRSIGFIGAAVQPQCRTLCGDRRKPPASKRGVAGLRFTLLDTREESPRQKVKALKKEQKRTEKQARKEARNQRKAEKKRAKAKQKRAKTLAQSAKQSASASASPKGQAQSTSSQKQSQGEPKEDGFTATVKEVLALIRRCFPQRQIFTAASAVSEGHHRHQRGGGGRLHHCHPLRTGPGGVNTTLGLLAGYGADLKLDALCIQAGFCHRRIPAVDLLPGETAHRRDNPGSPGDTRKDHRAFSGRKQPGQFRPALGFPLPSKKQTISRAGCQTRECEGKKV